MRNNKILILALIIFLISSVSSFAMEKCEDIKVFFKNIKIIVNNKSIDLENEPFIYRNRIYVPLRFISESLNASVLWNDESNTVYINNFQDIPECNPLEGERFIYGEILNIDREKRMIHIYQHIDDNSIEENPDLLVTDDPIIILKRNDKIINLDFSDLKIGDMAGIVVNKNNKARGIIIE